MLLKAYALRALVLGTDAEDLERDQISFIVGLQRKGKKKRKYQSRNHERRLQSMDCGGEYRSGGGAERPGIGVQMERRIEIYAATCQEQYQILFSGQEALFFFCLCSF